MLSLSGCSDDSSSSADPATPSPTASSSSADPSPTEDAETPEEFVRRWVEADTKMTHTGETGTYRAMSKGCKGCQDYADQIEQIYADGGYVETEGWNILRARTAGPTNQGIFEVRITVDAAPTKYVEKEGGPVRTLPGGRVDYIIYVTEVGDSFVTSDFAEVAS
jgi:hypothetical protein